MKKKGFTFIELMIAISIFLMMVVFVVKLDSNTHKQIRNITDISDKTKLAQGELEKLKSNPGGQLDTLKAAPQTKFTKQIDDYTVEITGTTNNNVYTTNVEVFIKVRKTSAAPDNNPYELIAHVLIK